MLTGDLLAMVAAKYSEAHAFFTNVADGTGTARSRLADGLAVSLWPSRGLEVEGFELKVSRGDWLRELKAPAKAEAVCRYCDRWWVVTADKDVIKDDELPPTWGWMFASGNGLRIGVKAPKLSPVPLDRCFVAAIARRAIEQGAAAKQIDKAREEGKEIGRNERAYELKNLRELAERVKAFEKASGIVLDPSNYMSRFTWKDPTQIGAAVLSVLGEGEEIAKNMREIQRAAQQVLEIVNQALKPDKQVAA